MLTALSVGKGGLGRFGNICFTISGVIGIAIKSGQPYAFPRFQTHDNANFGDPVDDIEQYLVNELPRIPTGLSFQDYGYFWGYRDIELPAGNWSIDAHLQDARYFDHCMSLIRDTFRFKDEPEQNDYVAIHYRAGDYDPNPDGYHPRCSKKYYEKAIAMFPDRTEFIFFSDDNDKAYEMFKSMSVPANSRFSIAHTKGSYIDDFKLMKCCKSFITANSSFSLFAAILGEHPDKKIICPSKWFGKAADIKFEGYPANAIII